MAENTLPQVFARLLPLPQLRGRDLTVQEIAMALGVSRRTAFRYLATALDGVERTAI